WADRGRCDSATGLHLYHVFEISQHRTKKSKTERRFAWVGFPEEKEVTWENAGKIEEIAPGVVEE
ncbi:hypothetical protein IWW34DRAFT_568625, partial [Fusarium oxysporum f. sp. albedinis]